ncbi:MAG TPA: hypothetical protein VN376_00910, partial [Longilinea sp.]|nr:hypothetical protein [Longilinea sp.]
MSTEPSPQATNQNKTLISAILPLYVFAALYNVLNEPPPYFSPLTSADIMFQISGLVLCLLPFIAAPFIYSKQKKSLRQAWREFTLYQKGILSLLAAGLVKSAFVLLLLIPFPQNDTMDLAAAFITALILVLKWNGVFLATSSAVFIRKVFLTRRAEGKSTAMLVFCSILGVV